MRSHNVSKIACIVPKHPQKPRTWFTSSPSTSVPPSATVLRAMVADLAMSSAD